MTNIATSPHTIHSRFGLKLKADSPEYAQYKLQFDLPDNVVIYKPETKAGKKGILADSQLASKDVKDGSLVAYIFSLSFTQKFATQIKEIQRRVTANPFLNTSVEKKKGEVCVFVKQNNVSTTSASS